MSVEESAAEKIQDLEDRLRILSTSLRVFAEATNDYEHLLDVVARTLAQVVKDGCVVRLLSDGEWLRPVAMHFPIEGYIRDLDVIAKVRAHVATPQNIASHTAAGKVLQTGQALLVPKLDLESIRKQASPEIAQVYETIGIHSLLIVALRVRGESFGLLSLFRFAPNSPPFSPSDLALAQVLADQASLVIANSRLLQTNSRELEEKRQSENALRKTHADVIKNTTIGLTVWRIEDLNDLRSFILTAGNPAAERALGVQLESRIGEKIHAIFPDVSLEQLKKYIELIKTGEARDFGESVVTHGNAKGHTFSVRAFPLPNQSIGFSFEDITDRKHRENARLRLAAIVESSTDAIVSRSLDGIITSWNRGAEQTFHLLASEALGKPLGIIIPDAQLAQDHEVVERLKQGELVAPFETVRKRKSGGDVTVSSAYALIHDEQGKIVGVSTIERDITEAKRIEQALIQAKDAAEAANKELEAFSYSVSHDLRTPLRGIDGFSLALLEDYGPSFDEQAKRYLARIRSGAQKMGQVIDEMIRLAKVSRIELQWGEVDLSQIARDILEDLQRNNPQRVVEALVTDGMKVKGDIHLLRIALDNLLSNAWKFTTSQPFAKIEVGRTERPQNPVYFVRDNGVGFDMKYAGKLFSAFQRLHSPSEFPGSGIGLATVQRVISRHGGKIWAEGLLNSGATFFFTL